MSTVSAGKGVVDDLEVKAEYTVIGYLSIWKGKEDGVLITS